METALLITVSFWVGCLCTLLVVRQVIRVTVHRTLAESEPRILPFQRPTLRAYRPPEAGGMIGETD